VKSRSQWSIGVMECWSIGFRNFDHPRIASGRARLSERAAPSSADCRDSSPGTLDRFTSRSPSPRPSPPGRGGSDDRLSKFRRASTLQSAAERFSLSLGERAGVRGNGSSDRPHGCDFAGHLCTLVVAGVRKHSNVKAVRRTARSGGPYLVPHRSSTPSLHHSRTVSRSHLRQTTASACQARTRTTTRTIPTRL
jgi:hypothetical protein